MLNAGVLTHGEATEVDVLSGHLTLELHGLHAQVGISLLSLEGWYDIQSMTTFQ